MAFADRVINANQLPLWLYILDRFGIPTLFALGTALALILYNQQAREDLRELRAEARQDRVAFLAALKENTAAIDALGARVAEVEKVVRESSKKSR